MRVKADGGMILLRQGFGGQGVNVGGVSGFGVDAGIFIVSKIARKVIRVMHRHNCCEVLAVASVFLGPQINYTWSSRLSAMVGADLPVSIVSSGEQVVPAYRVRPES